jgi:hypothetical protein
MKLDPVYQKHEYSFPSLDSLIRVGHMLLRIVDWSKVMLLTNELGIELP